MLINILIPTYNREPDLKVNLLYLIGEIQKDELQTKVSIIVSDNCSQDQTQESITGLIENYPKIKIEYFRQKENIGLEKNAVFVFSKATAGHVMFIGDDDLIDKDYLCFCTTEIKKAGHNKLGTIIPGIKSVDRLGNEKIGRVHNYSTKQLSAGYVSMYQHSHMAHQMSGLVVNTQDLLKKYLEKEEYRNPYLFIYFVAYNLLFRDSIFAPKYKTAVNIDNEKDWGYNEIGLLDEVFKSYYYFENQLKGTELARILVHFIRMHPYRINLKTKNPLTYYKTYRSITEQVYDNGAFKRRLITLLVKEYILNLK